MNWTGLAVSDPTTHQGGDEWTAGLTVLHVSPTAAAIRHKGAQGAVGQGWWPGLVLALAGTNGPTRPEAAPDRRPGRQHQRAQRARWTGAWRAAKRVLRCAKSNGICARVFEAYRQKTKQRTTRASYKKEVM